MGAASNQSGDASAPFLHVSRNRRSWSRRIRRDGARVSPKDQGKHRSTWSTSTTFDRMIQPELQAAMERPWTAALHRSAGAFRAATGSRINIGKMLGANAFASPAKHPASRNDPGQALPSARSGRGIEARVARRRILLRTVDNPGASKISSRTLAKELGDVKLTRAADRRRDAGGDGFPGSCRAGNRRRGDPGSGG